MIVADLIAAAILVILVTMAIMNPDWFKQQNLLTRVFLAALALACVGTIATGLF
jgi:hypothetical protein